MGAIPQPSLQNGNQGRCDRTLCVLKILRHTFNDHQQPCARNPPASADATYQSTRSGWWFAYKTRRAYRRALLPHTVMIELISDLRAGASTSVVVLEGLFHSRAGLAVMERGM